MRHHKPKLPGLPLHSQLACAVTEYDRRMEKKPHHNIWALSHYLKGCDQIEWLVRQHNLSVPDAVCTCFLDRLQSFVLKFLGYPIADIRTIRNGMPQHRKLLESYEE
jgi:hypothetical protein